MKEIKKNLYLFTPETQSFLLKNEKFHYSQLRHVERKIRQLMHMTEPNRDNLSSIIYTNITYKAICDYIEDMHSEIKKYVSIIRDENTIKQLRNLLISKVYAFSQLSSLMDYLNQALIATDQLVILILTAEKLNTFESKRTAFSLKFRLKKRFSKLIYKIQQLSLKKFEKTTASDFLNHPENYSDADRKKIMNILQLGFIKRYKKLQEAA